MAVAYRALSKHNRRRGGGMEAQEPVIDGQGRQDRYASAAALNFTTNSAGTRPRSLTSMPWLLAHSRTSEGFGPLLGALRALPRPPPRAPPLTLRPAPIYLSSAFRNSVACAAFRSIS